MQSVLGFANFYSEIILWHAKLVTPLHAFTRMQSDNSPNLTAEVSDEFMKASQITEVTSTAGHPRTQGLAEQKNAHF